ncbi:MAG: MMPL family transporter [Planctomycetota bacterium]
MRSSKFEASTTFPAQEEVHRDQGSAPDFEPFTSFGWLSMLGFPALMNAIRSALGSVWAPIVRFRFVTLFLCLVITAFAVVGMTRLGIEGDNRSMFRSHTTAFADYEQLRESFGTHENDLIVLIESDDIFDEGTLAAIHMIHSEADELEDVEDAMSIFTMRKSRRIGRYIPPILHPELTQDKIDRVRDQVLQHPLAKGQLICESGKTSIIVLKLASEDPRLVSRVTGRVEDIIHRANPPETTRVTLTGFPKLRLEVIKAVQRDFLYLGGVAIGLSALVAIVLFRQWTAILIVCIAPLAGVIWTLGLMGWVGEPLNILNAIVPTIVLVIGFTDSVHLMFQVRRDRDEGLAPIRASLFALRRVGPACVLASVTTAIGFASLAIAEDQLLQRFGVTCAVGALLAMTAVLTLVPVITSTRLGLRCVTRDAQVAWPWTGRLAESVIDRILAAPLPTAAFGIVLTAVLLLFASQLKPDFHFTKSLPPNNAAFLGLQRCDDSIDGITPINVLIQVPEDEKLSDPQVYEVLASVHAAIEEQEGVSYPISLLSMLQSLPGRSPAPASRLRELVYLPKSQRAKFLNTSDRSLRVMACVKDLGAAELLPICESLKGRLATIAYEHPGYEMKVSGMSVVSAYRVRQMITDLIYSLTTAAVLILVLLTLAFRSFWLGLVSVIPNAIPLVATAAILSLAGEPLRYASVVCFCISLGLAVDDTIHFLWRYRRQSRELTDRVAAIRKTFLLMAPALVTTTVLLLIGFGAAIFSPVPTLRVFGGTACLAILWALAGDLVVLPALLACPDALSAVRWQHFPARLAEMVRGLFPVDRPEELSD